MLNTLRYIHANPKAAGVRKDFYDPYSYYGNYNRLKADGISELPPAFLKLSATIDGFAKCYERFCKHYRHKSKAAPNATGVVAYLNGWWAVQELESRRRGFHQVNNDCLGIGIFAIHEIYRYHLGCLINRNPQLAGNYLY